MPFSPPARSTGTRRTRKASPASTASCQIRARSIPRRTASRSSPADGGGEYGSLSEIDAASKAHVRCPRPDANLRSAKIPSATLDEQAPTPRRPRIRRLLRSLLSPSKFALVGIVGIVVNQVALYALTDGLGINDLHS